MAVDTFYPRVDGAWLPQSQTGGLGKAGDRPPFTFPWENMTVAISAKEAHICGPDRRPACDR